jgi:hypothetical protein
MDVSCHRSFLPGTSLEPAVNPTSQASSFTLLHPAVLPVLLLLSLLLLLLLYLQELFTSCKLSKLMSNSVTLSMYYLVWFLKPQHVLRLRDIHRGNFALISHIILWILPSLIGHLIIRCIAKFHRNPLPILMNQTGSYETSLHLCQTTRRHISEGSNLSRRTGSSLAHCMLLRGALPLVWVGGREGWLDLRFFLKYCLCKVLLLSTLSVQEGPPNVFLNWAQEWHPSFSIVTLVIIWNLILS